MTTTSASAGSGQIDLLLFPAPRKRGRGPKIVQGEVDAFICALYRRGWVRASALGATSEKQKRILRAVAAASKGHIISGQGGYRLAFEATADEHRKFVSWFKAQEDQMRQRRVDAERVYHRKEVPACLRERVRQHRPAA